VQKTLAANRVERGACKGKNQVSLLAGLIYDAHDKRMTPSHAVKKGVRYRYYVSKSLLTGDKKAKKMGQRIPAAQIETLVAGRIRSWLAGPVAVLNAVQCCRPDAVAQKRLLDEAAQLASSWQDLPAQRLRSILRAVVVRVQVCSNQIEVTLNQMGVALWLNGKDPREPAYASGDDRERRLTSLTIPAQLKRTGIEMRLVVDDGSEPSNVGQPGPSSPCHSRAPASGAKPAAKRDRYRAGDQQFLRYASLKARLPRPRHCHGDLERKAPSAAQCQPVDGRHPPASGLGGSARVVPLLSALIAFRSQASPFSVSLAHQELRLRPGDGGTVNGRQKRRSRQRRSIGAPKVSLATACDEN